MLLNEMLPAFIQGRQLLLASQGWGKLGTQGVEVAPKEGIGHSFTCAPSESHALYFFGTFQISTKRRLPPMTHDVSRPTSASSHRPRWQY